MALKVTNDDAQIAYSAMKARLRAFRQYVSDVRAACAAGPVSGNLIIEFFTRLVAEKAANVVTAAVPGIAQWAQDRDGGATYNVAAEFAVVNAAIDAAGAWVMSNFPASGGYILKDQLGAGGVTVRSFSVADTAGFRTVLDSLLATLS